MQDSEGNTALMWATGSGNGEIAEALITAGAAVAPEAQDTTVLIMAVTEE